ncbi:DUF6455 family protein [Albibacillus kandeliae]|jgi:hypothetical protein|uniref:DUF6455 family protein n=1 Tax=Albibacillus kandeliae TaxID=2174228 RepID=UPI000D689EC8|nr:DUF6455 family protein [Albibacillus kandeliae]
MIEQAKLRRHADLLDRMATTVGVDLEEAVLVAGTMRMDELADAVLRCTDCSDPGHCAGWLALHGTPAEQTPSYCRNRDLLMRLRA